ncbi:MULTISPECIES: hypothetical protein [Bradyrhizobium]|uniref:DUF3426 domain-containing protein n=1 Tax=Bradyrhizobium ottawaense TaxID=931866 RepID=A0ABV4FZY0_9BRAD|nr:MULTISPECIES: hypothetical protein [Bradyrhizobium]MBR1291281.1 hypothetical protein [Bradyrhizobium ottawaense]MDA9416203.1 hypothetical protein [Bradyrhizobium sp. CCBAU 25360]MDA9486532.1 hypothetical protein [Bradyrhizobium sp. CCBAU 11445]WLB43302.1 hypothetical protein QIH93_22460 [Bradyrhizobium ottawaense]WQN80610.1 hypothetical protein U7859_26925 [Bradyrhizobium ottawaense]
MNARLDRIGLGRFAGTGERVARAVTIASVSFGRSLLWLLAAIIVGCGVWMLLPPSKGNSAEPLKAELAVVEPAPPGDTAVAASPVSEAQAPAKSPAAAELDRLRISSQTWRRGGLGSRALVTFTLRNDNDYAVKDVEIVCAFTRRDGSHLTNRSRVLADPVSMKSRKTFAHIPVGFINVNADQAKCSLVAARRA